MFLNSVSFSDLVSDVCRFTVFNTVKKGVKIKLWFIDDEVQPIFVVATCPSVIAINPEIASWLDKSTQNRRDIEDVIYFQEFIFQMIPNTVHTCSYSYASLKY